MRKLYTLLTCAIAAMAIVSCSKEIENNAETPEAKLFPMTITATSTDTKTELIDRVSIKWLSTDKLSVFDGKGNREFKSNGVGKTVTFSGDADEAETYYAIYPYNAEANLTGTTVTTTLASEQQAKAGSFADGLNINASKAAATEDFHFTNVLSVAKVSVAATNLDGHTIKSVKLSSNYALAGDITVSYGETITAAAGTNAVKEITLEGGESGLSDGDYYFCLLPNDGGDITLTFTDTKGQTATKTASLGKAFTAGTIKNLGTVKGLEWKSTEKYYVKVTSAAELTDGDYLIVYEGENGEGTVAFNGGLETLDAASNNISVEITKDGIVQSTQVDAAIFTINQSAGTIKSKSGQYIGVSSNSNGLKQSEDATVYSNSISFNEGGIVISAAFEGSVMSLRYNKAANNERFRYYKNNGQEPIALYKLDERLNPGMSWNASSATATIEDGDVINFTAPTLTAGYATGITYESSDPTVASVSAAGEVSILAEGKTTIKAIFAGDAEYKPQTVQYTLTVTDNRTPVVTYDFETVAGLNALATDTATEFFGTLTNAVISFVPNTSNAVIKDATGSVLVFKENHGYKQGQTFSGELTVKVKSYNNASEITEINKEFVGEGTVVEPETVSLSDLVGNFDSWQNAYVHVDDLEVVSVNNKTINVKNGDNTYVVYSSSANATCVTGDIIAVTGTIAQFNNKDQIKAWTVDDIVITQEHQKAKHTITFTQPEEGGSFTVSANGTQIVSGTELDEGTVVSLNATADDGYIFDGWTVTGTTVNDDIFTVGTEDITITASFKVNTGTTTATIYFGTNDVKINDTSVTGTDSKGNTWTINTVITESSFTQQPTYSQVGASKKPATSITFTTTLPETVQKVDNLSIKLGGFSGTEGTVKLKVGDVEIGTGSLNGTNDVTVSSTTGAEGNTIQITVTEISKGVKVYYIEAEYE